MKRPLRPLFGVGLPLLAIVSFFVLLAYSLSHLFAIQARMRLEAPHNMLWVISRAQVASFRLANTVSDRAAGQADADELQRQYHVFLSRLHLLGQGPQRRQVEAFGYADRLDSLAQGLPELQARIAALQVQGDGANAREVERLLQPYIAILGQASTKAMVAGWDGLGSKLDDARDKLWWVIGSLAGILLAGIALIIHALLAIRHAHERTRLLNQEKAFSQLLIGSSGENIIAVDMERRCTVWNAAAEQLFACPADTAQGWKLGDVSSFFEVERVRRAVDEALAGHKAELLDQPFFCDSRSEARYVDLRCFALYEREHIIGAILLIFDVTERHAAQREIAMHRDHLEELVHARTQELDAALERERATAELYRNFGAMVSHQFRTPLAIVDSSLQRLIRRGEKLSLAEVRERSGRAREAIKRMTKLIECTLDAGRLDAGQVEVHNQLCDLTLLAAGICEQQRAATSDRVIELTLPEDAAPFVNCDPTHVEHILNNLLANAIKYSHAGSPVRVEVRCTDGRVECAVINQGTLAGLEEGESDVLFTRYFRGDNAKGHTGIGIGLYMARALARLQDGDVRLVQDKEGVITFILCLPRVAAPYVALSDMTEKRA
ncbi:two-component system histidine kinase [Pusillimonas sp. T7-7]|uniref:sensor histidine kinase n=1 Tax=Pusillimonas sp. (strain T7-7) TaxID=1007105 RepID=UPI0002084837|nr:PAS domain-containing sensor histidine kinase [Pusillimonas sp. T7-7]AEC18726.1 two-component system histidine kinase [Pusillimonas sp. T7-7]